jgi:hypothetical protein
MLTTAVHLHLHDIGKSVKASTRCWEVQCAALVMTQSAVPVCAHLVNYMHVQESIEHVLLQQRSVKTTMVLVLSIVFPQVLIDDAKSITWSQ